MLGALNAMVTLLGIILGFAGVALTFITFFSPGTIQKLALRSPKSWVKVPSRNSEIWTYRHRVYSGFTIEVNFSEPVSGDDFFEPWMDALHRPDQRAASYYVTLFFNGLPMDQLLFLQYDGARNFIPVPIQQRIKNRIYYSFSPEQRRFADIVGSDYFDRPFSEVASMITNSRYNPFFLSTYDKDLKERLESLDRRINALKSRYCGKNMS